MLLRVLGWAFAVTAVLAGGWLGRNVPFAEQWPMFEALRTTAAIIFGVIGAWLAIIYPERLKLSFRAAPEEKAKESGLGQLFTPVVNSTLILGVILAAGVIAPIMKHYPIAIEKEWLRGTSYGLLVTLTLWQLWTVLLTLRPASTIKTFADVEDQTTHVMAGLTRLAQPRQKNGDTPGP